MDNDWFAKPANEDRNYSFGLLLSFSGQWVECWPLSTHRLQGRINRLWLTNRETEGRLSTTVFGLSGFTPDDLRRQDPILDDRPYASLLYTTSLQIDVLPAQDGALPRVALRSELSWGLLGLPVGEFVQENWHTFLRSLSGNNQPFDPKGWNNQISDGGEPTARYTIERLQLLTSDRDGSLYDVTWTTDGSLGYYTNLSTGLTLRLGRITTPFYATNLNPTGFTSLVSTAAAQPHGPATLLDRPRNTRKELYLYGSARARLIGYNVMLQGQFRDSEVTFSSDDIERIIYEGQVGAVWEFRLNHRLIGFLAGRSDEFDGSNARPHYWGGLYWSKSVGAK